MLEVPDKFSGLLTLMEAIPQRRFTSTGWRHPTYCVTFSAAAASSVAARRRYGRAAADGSFGGAGSAALVVRHQCGRRRHQAIDRHLSDLKRDFDLHLLRRMINTIKGCECSVLQHNDSWLASSAGLFTFNCTVVLEWREGLRGLFEHNPPSEGINIDRTYCAASFCFL